ncbi:MAG: hypothetical protein U0871_25940 [Gemmataceae bacterium]
MPIVAPSRLDTTLPGMTARQVWHGPDLQSHALLVLTYSRLYLLPAGSVVTPGMVAAVRGSADPEAVLGRAVAAVELAAIRRVVADLTADRLTLEVVGAGVGSTRVSLAFKSAEAADAAFTALWKRIGDGFDLTPYKLEGWAAVQGPVLAMLGVALAMLVLGLGLSGLEDYAAAQAALPDEERSALAVGVLDPLAGRLNWRWVCGFGGVVLAVLQVWLYHRLTAPPARLELVRR